MQVKDKFFGSWALYLSFGTCYIICFVNVTTPEIFCSMRSVNSKAWAISALTQASVLIQQKTPIIYFVQSGMIWNVKAGW